MNYSTLLRRWSTSSPTPRASSRETLCEVLMIPPAAVSRPRHDLPLGALRQLSERARAAADLRPDADAVGPRRGQRLRAAHDRPTRCRTRRRTRSCCTRPSATTRSRTSPPRSRPARSAPASTSRRSTRAALRRRPALRDPGDQLPAVGGRLPVSHGSALVYWDGGPLDRFPSGGAPRRRTATSAPRPRRLRRRPPQLPP